MPSGIYPRYSFSLSKWELKILWKKYVTNGFTHIEANDKIENMKECLKELVKKLRKKDKSPEEIHKRFIDSYHKMCQRAEVEKPGRKG